LRWTQSSCSRAIQRRAQNHLWRSCLWDAYLWHSTAKQAQLPTAACGPFSHPDWNCDGFICRLRV